MNEQTRDELALVTLSTCLAVGAGVQLLLRRLASSDFIAHLRNVFDTAEKVLATGQDEVTQNAFRGAFAPDEDDWAHKKLQVERGHSFEIQTHPDNRLELDVRGNSVTVRAHAR